MITSYFARLLLEKLCVVAYYWSLITVISLDWILILSYVVPVESTVKRKKLYLTLSIPVVL